MLEITMLWLYAKIIFWCAVAGCAFFGFLVLALVIWVCAFPKQGRPDYWTEAPEPDPDDAVKGA